MLKAERYHLGCGLVIILLSHGLGHPDVAAQETRQEVGDTRDAMPGLGHVKAAILHNRGIVISGFSGYGFSSNVLDTNDKHHRVLGNLSASYRPMASLAFGLRLDGRYDRHHDTTGKDDGLIGEPRLIGRFVHALSSNLGVGAQLGVWFPGSKAPSFVLSATSADLVSMVSYRAADLSLSANIGFRLDRSAKTVDTPTALSAADRVALGASDSNAALFGIGADYSIGNTELLAEWSYDLLVGKDAPVARESPMRISAGARFPLARDLSMQFMVDLNVGRFPVIDPMSPLLVPIEPTVEATIGIHYRLPPARPVIHKEIAHTNDTPLPPPRATARGQVMSAGAPIAGAKVTVESGKDRREAISDVDGEWKLGDLPLGAATITVSAEGFEPRTTNTTLAADQESAIPTIVLDRILPPGQLRGFVRGYDGKGLKAKLTIESLNKTFETKDDGSFEIDLPPGEYAVSVVSPAHEAQEKTAVIHENAVLILNVDLHRKR